MREGKVILTWMDDRTESFFGHVRLLDTGGGVLQVVENRTYGPEEVKISVPVASLRSWTTGDWP